MRREFELAGAALAADAEGFTTDAMCAAIERAIRRLDNHPIRLRPSEQEYDEKVLRAALRHLTPRPRADVGGQTR